MTKLQKVKAVPTEIVVTAHPCFSYRIDFSVTYLETSFKNMKRSRHAMICGHGTAVFGSNQNFLVNFSNFLAISNKKNYGAFFCAKHIG